MTSFKDITEETFDNIAKAAIRDLVKSTIKATKTIDSRDWMDLKSETLLLGDGYLFLNLK